MLEHLFVRRRALPCEGNLSEGGRRALLDATGDGGVDLSDVVRLLGFVFAGGAAHALGSSCVEIAGCPEVCAGL